MRVIGVTCIDDKIFSIIIQSYFIYQNKNLIHSVQYSSSSSRSIRSNADGLFRQKADLFTTWTGTELSLSLSLSLHVTAPRYSVWFTVLRCWRLIKSAFPVVDLLWICRPSVPACNRRHGWAQALSADIGCGLLSCRACFGENWQRTCFGNRTRTSSYTIFSVS